MSTNNKPMNPCFVTRKAELNYALTQTTGAQRSKLLNVEDDFYNNKDKATEWYNTILAELEPIDGDVEEAVVELKNWYELMFKHFFE